MKQFQTSLCLMLFGIVNTFCGDIWIDVRSYREYQQNGIPSHHHIPHDMISERITELKIDSTDTIHLYCAVGGRAGYAVNILKQMGYTKLINEGGIEEVRNKITKQP